MTNTAEHDTETYASADPDHSQWPRLCDTDYSRTMPKENPTQRQLGGATPSFAMRTADRPVTVHHSRTRDESGSLAQRIIGERVLGFNIKWTWKPEYPSWESTVLREKVSCIVLAAEDKIGVFHIALHEGDTAEELIAPALQRIIEDPTVTKAGPRSAFELCHLHNLVEDVRDRGYVVSTKLVKFEELVRTHLGHLLWRPDSEEAEDCLGLISAELRAHAAADNA
ncbi:hypothetical protein F4778DRAFT_787939 [Xylariomycetidae sp. FL2044]|nr:hypothetical protein F4778DRAFT_787939 [Xylariomycetidae sp. FL2044]